MALAGGLLLGEKAGELDPDMPMPNTKAPGAGRKIAMLVHPRISKRSDCSNGNEHSAYLS